MAYEMRISDWSSDLCSSDLLPRQPAEAPHWIRLPIEILVLACLLVGIVPALTIGPFLASAVQSVLGARAPSYSLVVWHGFTMPLLQSVIALVGGPPLYPLFRDRLNAVEKPRQCGRPKGARASAP